MPLCCKHKLSPRLAETPGFRASCVYSECRTHAAGSLTVSEEQTPLCLNDTQTSGHPQSTKKSWAAPLTSSFPSPLMPADSWAKHTGPRLGSVSAALGNEKTKSNIICVSDCAAVTESKTDTSSSKQRDYSSQGLRACDNAVVADLVSVLYFIKALEEELYRCIMRNPILGPGRAYIYILLRVSLATLVRKTH